MAGIRTIYEITERTIDRYGQYFITLDIGLGTYRANTSLQDETIIGQESLKKSDSPSRKKVRRHRIRTVISNLMQFAGHLTEQCWEGSSGIREKQPVPIWHPPAEINNLL